MSKDQNVLHGPELLQNIPKQSFGKTLYNCLEEHLNLPIAYIDAVTQKNVSYKALYEKCLHLAHSLQKLGITKNDVIAISSENSVQFSCPLIAGLWVGATVTLFNPHYTTRELHHVIDISKPTVVFCYKVSIKEILKTCKNLDFIKKIIVINECSEVDIVESMEQFIAKNLFDFRQFIPVEVDEEDVALIMYSSGTTGLAKGVMLTHRNLNFTRNYYCDHRIFYKTQPGTVTMHGLMPFFHAAGCTILLVSIFNGHTVIVFPKFEPHIYLKTIQDFKIVTLPIVPPIANFLATSPLVDQYDLSHVVHIHNGASFLNQHISNSLLNRFKNVSEIRQGYGLTESSGLVIVLPHSTQKHGSYGKLLPGTSAKVVNIDTGNTVGPGKEGELYFKGPQIMKGYAGDVKNTDSILDRDGWLRTGDLGYYDEEGHFYITGRLKDLIKYKGFQVSPAELESILLEHPQIEDAAVVGHPDDLAGEIPIAFVVKTKKSTLTENNVKEFVAGQVSPHKFLREVKFIDEIPKTATGKVLKRKLKEFLVQKSKL